MSGQRVWCPPSPPSIGRFLRSPRGLHLLRLVLVMCKNCCVANTPGSSAFAMACAQRGDAFDMAQLLAALLLGAGYDAYVAVGSAPAHIAANDVSRTRCPALVEDLGESKGASWEPSAGPQYCTHAWVVVLPTQREVRTCAFPACMHALNVWKAQLRIAPMAGPVVLCILRQVSEVLMLEPASGLRWPAAAAPYTRLEVLYNARNFWACLQVAQQHMRAGEARSAMARLAYDLADASKWEALFLPLEPQVGLLSTMWRPLSAISACVSCAGTLSAPPCRRRARPSKCRRRRGPQLL